MANTVLLLKRKTKISVQSNGRVVRKHVHNYQISADVKLSTVDAAALLGVNPFLPYEFDSAALLRDVDCEHIEKTRAPWRYSATVEWSTETPDQSEEKNENPLLDPVEVDITTKEQTIAVLYDRDDELITNLAGDPFNPPIQRPLSNTVMTFVRNEPSYRWSTPYTYVDHVNQTAIWDAQPAYVKCVRFHAKRATRGKHVYWPHTYEFEYNPLGWQPRTLQQGLKGLMVIDGKEQRVAITDPKTGLEVTDAVPLVKFSNDPGGVPAHLPYLVNEVGPILPEYLPDKAQWTSPNVLPEAEFKNLGLPLHL